MGMFAVNSGPSGAELAAMASAQAHALQAQTLARQEYFGRMAAQNPQNIAMGLEQQRLANQQSRMNIDHTGAQTGLLNTQNKWFGPTAASNIAQNYESANVSREQARGLNRLTQWDMGSDGGPPQRIPGAPGLAYGAPIGDGQMPARGVDGYFGWGAGAPPASGPMGAPPARRRPSPTVSLDMSPTKLPSVSALTPGALAPRPTLSGTGVSTLGAEADGLGSWLQQTPLSRTSDQSRTSFFGSDAGSYRPQLFRGDWG